MQKQYKEIQEPTKEPMKERNGAEPVAY